MTYKEAIKTPKGGMVSAVGDQMTALYADQLAGMLCVRAEALYKWSQLHGENLSEIYNGIALKKIDPRLIILALLNNIPRNSPELYPF